MFKKLLLVLSVSPLGLALASDQTPPVVAPPPVTPPPVVAPGVIDDVPPPAYGRWAALAYGRDNLNQGRIGRAFSEGSEYLAKQAAIRACHLPGCEIKVYVETGCIGIANGYDLHSNWQWYGFGAARYARIRGAKTSDQLALARTQAGEMAKSICDANTGARNCNIIETYCTWDAAQGNNAELVRAWLGMMGGEFDRGVRNTLQFFNVASQGHLLNHGLTFQQASCVNQRRWARLEQVAVTCQITPDQLDRIYAESNRY